METDHEVVVLGEGLHRLASGVPQVAMVVRLSMVLNASLEKNQKLL
jgi:hypothetical protein